MDKAGEIEHEFPIGGIMVVLVVVVMMNYVDG